MATHCFLPHTVNTGRQGILPTPPGSTPSWVPPPPESYVPAPPVPKNQESQAYLHARRVDTLVAEKRELVLLHANQSVEKAIQVLSDNNILSAPVVDPDSDAELPYSFVDMQDILTFVLSVYTQAPDDDRSPNSRMGSVNWGQFCQDIDTLTHRGVRFGMKPIRQLTDLSGRDPFCPVFGTASLYHLAETFAHGVHRVPVLDDDGRRITHVVSQSSVVQHLATHLYALGPLRYQTVMDLLPSMPVISMSSSAQAIHAFYLMHGNHVGAVAVVDEDAKMIANISASDIKGLNQRRFQSLLLPVVEFLTLSGNGRKKPKCPVTCRKTDTFETALLKMAHYAVHRVWVVDDMFRPVSVITMTDVMGVLVAEA
eukprot:TRINITY_DN13200_c0_g1_i1.p1 TRINITY_DN13200_c0_g1~~TRINITY_DN13200_c0_g1_i1.p1  ORF type:complete len:398 (-),score=47.47 TRINITY_DN13200_c0_g1_i1:48-1154(-)